MTDRDEMSEREAMTERAKMYIAERNLKTAYSDEAQVFADFALAEIARHEAELRAKIVAELEWEIGKVDAGAYDGWNDGINRCIEIVRGESKES